MTTSWSFSRFRIRRHERQIQRRQVFGILHSQRMTLTLPSRNSTELEFRMNRCASTSSLASSSSSCATQTTCPSKYTRHEAFTAAANCSRLPVPSAAVRSVWSTMRTGWIAAARSDSSTSSRTTAGCRCCLSSTVVSDSCKQVQLPLVHIEDGRDFLDILTDTSAVRAHIAICARLRNFARRR